MKKTLATFLSALAVTATVTVAAPARADDKYPSRPIRLVVGFSAGGPTDVIARVIAKDMSVTLGQSVYVENKPGASSMIATREIKNAAPDGYSLLFSSLGLNVNPILLGADAGYNPKTDFAPISNAAILPMVAVTGYNSPYKTINELVAKIKSAPEAVTFGSSGNGGSGHLAAEMMGTLVKQKMLHVPFKGNGPALLEVMAGRVDFMFFPIIGIADSVEHKKVRLLAVGTPKRMAQFPDVPTMAEAGLSGVENTAPWVGMLAPAKTPPEIINKLNDAMVKALAKPDVKAQMEKLGANVVGDSPAAFAEYLKKDYERYEAVIKAAGVKAQP